MREGLSIGLGAVKVAANFLNKREGKAIFPWLADGQGNEQVLVEGDIGKVHGLVGDLRRPAGLAKKAIFSGESLWKKPFMWGASSTLVARLIKLAVKVGDLSLPKGGPECCGGET